RPAPAHALPDRLVEALRVVARRVQHGLFAAVARQGRGVDVRLVDAPELLAGLGVHVAPGGARVDGVDGGALGQLAAPGARHGLEGGLAAGVDALALVADGGAHARDVDDAAGAVAREVRRDGL